MTAAEVAAKGIRAASEATCGVVPLVAGITDRRDLRELYKLAFELTAISRELREVLVRREMAVRDGEQVSP